MTTFDELVQQVDGLDHMNGINAVDILQLPPGLQPALRGMLRRPMRLEQLAGELRLAEDQARAIANKLVDKGLLISDDGVDNPSPSYRVSFARARTRHIPADL